MLRAAAIIVLGSIAYGSMLNSPFRVMDDRISIVENSTIKSANVPAIFKEGYFHDRSYYRPLVNLSFMAEYKLFGLHYFFYNLDNLILHILNALLVVLLVSRLTNNADIGFWTGLLFVVHPVQWEAVCNVPGRSILLSAFFTLSSFVLFLEFYKTNRWSYLPLVLITLFLGMLCKESAGVLPMVIMVYLSLDKARPGRQKVKYLLPFIIVIAVYLLLRKFLGITQVHQASQPLVLILGFVTFLRSVVTDLRLFVLPIDLHYDRCLPFLVPLGQPQAWGTCLFWAAALITGILLFRKIPRFVLFLMAWFLVELFPVSQLVTSIGVGAGHVSTAEHFLYLASVPVFVGMVMLFKWVYENKKDLVSRPLLKALAGGFLLFLLLTAVEQSIYASNEFIMLSRSLKFEPNNPRVQGAMAMVSVFRNDIPDAEKHFRLAINAEPLNPKYHIGLGTALCQQGKYIEGLEQFVVFDPGNDKELVEHQEKLTMAYIRQQLAQGGNFDSRGWLAIGIYYAKHSQDQPAVNAFLKSVRLNPQQADAWFNLGSIYEAEQNWPAAKMAYQKLLGLQNITYFQKDFASQHLSVIARTLSEEKGTKQSFKRLRATASVRHEDLRPSGSQ
jgi:hypothetical protein